MVRSIRVILLVAAALTTGSCSGGYVGDYMPQWAGGLPKDAPPRPGSPEYEEYRARLEHPPEVSAKDSAATKNPRKRAGPAKQALPAASQ